MKVLILCDHYPLSPRVKKTRDSLLKLYPDCIVKIYVWNRNNQAVSEDYVVSFNQNLGYGNKLKKLLNLFNFIKRAKQFSRIFKPTYIHAIDVEMLITSAFVKNKSKIIYEVYDIKFLNNKLLNQLRERIEFFIINKFNTYMILASPYFELYYSKLKYIKKIVINNKPSIKSLNRKNYGYMIKYEPYLQGKRVIGFIGTVRHEAILLNLINAAIKIGDIVILIAGQGPSYNPIKKYIEDNRLEKKAILTGRFDECDLKKIYESCDYIWAAYPSKDLNVKYAISNKYFESIVYKRKIIVSDSTYVGDYVNKLNIGYTVNPYDEIKIEKLLRILEKKYDYTEPKELREHLWWEDEEKEFLKIYQL